MKLSKNIIIVFLFIIVIFDYVQNYNAFGSSIKISTSNIDSGLSCVRINLVSVRNVDSMEVVSFSEENFNKIDKFIFNSNNKKISVDCFYNKNTHPEKIYLKVFSSGKEMDYLKKLK